MNLLRHFLLLLTITLLPNQAFADNETCQVNQAEKLFARKGEFSASIHKFLNDCVILNSRDYRVPMLLGVLAREDGNLDLSVVKLEEANSLAPKEIAPMAELAVTREWRNELSKARLLYEEILRTDPNSRSALLGLARVARGQFRLDEAHSIYSDHFLAQNPEDVDALNGMAWISLMNQKYDMARNEFQNALKIQPTNSEAQKGLVKSNNAWLNQLDFTVGSMHSDDGSSLSGGVSALVSVNATDKIDLGLNHTEGTLSKAHFLDSTPLPKNQFHVGYVTIVPDAYHASVTYEGVDRQSLPYENRIALDVGSYLSTKIQWFAGVREGIDYAKSDHLAHAGVILAIAPAWELVATIFVGRNWSYPGQTRALTLDVNHETADGMLINFGVGSSDNPDNRLFHTFVAWPMANQHALLLSSSYQTIGHEAQIGIGWRVYWK